MIIDHMILLITSCYQHGNLHHLHFCPMITTLVPALIIIHFNLTFYPNYYPRFLIYSFPVYLICCCSVAKPCLTLCNPMDCSTPGFPVLYHHPELAQTMSTGLVMPSNHLILCCLLLLLPSIFPSIRVFSNESALCIR